MGKSSTKVIVLREFRNLYSEEELIAKLVRSHLKEEALIPDSKQGGVDHENE